MFLLIWQIKNLAGMRDKDGGGTGPAAVLGPLSGSPDGHIVRESRTIKRDNTLKHNGINVMDIINTSIVL